MGPGHKMLPQERIGHCPRSMLQLNWHDMQCHHLCKAKQRVIRASVMQQVTLSCHRCQSGRYHRAEPSGQPCPHLPCTCSTNSNLPHSRWLATAHSARACMQAALLHPKTCSPGNKGRPQETVHTVLPVKHTSLCAGPL